MAEILKPRELERPDILGRARTFFLRQRGRLFLLLLAALTAWLAFSWYQTIYRIVRYYTPLPTWDYWRTAAFLKSYQALDFRILWVQHNEHRIVFPEIVFAADDLFLRGRQVLPLAISFLSYFGCWLLLVWTFARDAFVPSNVRTIGILLAGIIIGWQGSAAVLAQTFLLEWTLLQFAVLLALTFLARLGETKAKSDLIAVIACAVVATYTSANGLMLWPVLLVLALVLSIGKREFVLLAVAAAVSTSIYFVGYTFTGTLSIGNLFRHPLYLLGFLAAYLSMPFGAIKMTAFGIGVGLVSAASVAGLAIAAFRNRLSSSRPAIVLFGWYLFMVLTALLTAAGRMDPSEPTFSAAKAARYVTGPLVTWGVFILLWFWLPARLRWRFAPPYALTFIIGVLLLIGLAKFRWWLHGVDQERAKEQMAALAIELGVQDANVELGVFPDPAALDAWSQGLRASHLSVFYQSRSKWLGRAAVNYAPSHDSVVPGEITYTFPLLDSVEVAGWIDDSQLRQSTGWLLLANETGRIVGFGRKLPAGFPDMFDNPRTPPMLGWVGFVNLEYATKSVSAYAIDRRGLFPIEGTVDIPSVQPIRGQEAGPQMKGLIWQIDSGWTLNGILQTGILKQTSFGPAPSGPIYGSWSGDDRNTGRITSSMFPAPASACLILPVLQGPRAGRLSAQVIDADTGRAIAAVPFQNTDHQWVFWRLPLPASVKHLRITAEDMGKAWGEWMGIGNPSQCK
jgi:hypothetical protein